MAVGQIWVLRKDRIYYPPWNQHKAYPYEEGDKFIVKRFSHASILEIWILLDKQGRELHLPAEHVKEFMEFIQEDP